MRSILAGLVLVLVIAAPAVAGPKHAVSVTPDPAAFGSTVTVVYSTTEPNPWARVECVKASDGQLGQIEYTYLLSDNQVTLGPTDAWPSGAATCSIELLRSTSNGSFHRLASSSFEVTP